MVDLHNIILMTDSYKTSHWLQYPRHTRRVVSYFESRGGKFPAVTFFGLQYFIKRYLEGVQITTYEIDEAESVINAHMGKGIFNRRAWEYILQKHNGTLPVRIKAVLEGTTVPNSNVLMTIENTDNDCYWLTNYLETLLVETWYPTTVCTQSREIKKNILKYLEETGDSTGIGFKLHDFGFRGVSSPESAGIGGAAHLVNFMGTDTIAGIQMVMKYYNSGVCGFSIPAAEHSTITSWGKEHEAAAFENMLDQFPEGLVAAPIDSYDAINACLNILGKKLKDKIIARKGVFIARPDSGTPAIIVVEVLEALEAAFGSTENSKGYRVLPPYIRVIQGDGVNYESINSILWNMKIKGFSADNIAFGMGGALLQNLNRDTQKFAFKCSAVDANGGWRDVYKSPVTDVGKNSKRGKLALIKEKDEYQTIQEADLQGRKNELVTVFENGKLLIDQTFDEIKERARNCECRNG